MSLRDFKETLLLAESSQWRRSAGLSGGVAGQDRKPPKGRLRDQMATIERQAADLECTLVGDSLPPTPPCPLAGAPPPPPPSSPPLHHRPPLVSLVRPPKRRKLSDYAPSLVLDPCDPSLPAPLSTGDPEESSPIDGLPFDAHQADTIDYDCLDDEEDEDDGLSVNMTQGDSEAGLFIQSQSEGLQQPLILWPPEGETSNLDDAGCYVQVPASINGRLMQHQREGVRFLYRLYHANKGGVLGDDMGLGKTIQVIAFLAAILQSDYSSGKTKNEDKLQKHRKQALIVAPTSVLRNWEQEFHAWGAFEVAIYHDAYRETVLKKLESGSLQIVLTSFDTFRIHGESLYTINWDCLVVDEAHRLKNDKSDLYKVCSKVQTRRRYGLTGTIMQNKIMDLFNVFDWAAPGCLGSREHFREYYDEPLKQGQRISAPDRFVRIAEERKHHLANVLRNYLLRREKHGTIGHLMMGKEDNVIFCEMSPLQCRVYKRLLASPDFQSLTRKDEPCSCGSPLTRAECCFRTASQGIIWQYLHRESVNGCDSCPICLILPCLTKLQQVSNHLELIKPNPKDDPEKQKKDELLAELVLAEDAELVGGTAQEESFLGLSDTQHCGKMRALELLLAHWLQQGDKVLLFSYSVRMLDILDKFLIRKGYCFSRLDGSTAMSMRQSLVDDFNRSPSKQVFLISTRAGGLGLNLVSANRVVIFDPNWNPAQDLQAQDRSFRFGQRRHVTVYRLLAAGSLEELVYTRQIYKQQLFNIAVSGHLEKRYFEGVQDSKDNKGELFGITNLFKDLSEEAFTSEIIEKHEKRALSFRVKSFSAAINEKENEGLITGPMEGGDNTNISQSHRGFGNQAALQKCSRKQSPKDTIAVVLKAAGVVYAHRNEDVVNYKAATMDDVKISPSCSSAITDKLSLDLTITKKAIKPAGHKVIKACKEKSSASTGKEKSSASTCKHNVGSKEEQFDSLAKFKGMEKTEFCKWLLSVPETEKQDLLLEFKNKRQEIK